MTAYEDTVEFTGAGAPAIAAQQTLQDTVEITGAGSVEQSAEFQITIETTGAGAPAVSVKQSIQIEFEGAADFLPVHTYIFIYLDDFNIESWRVSKTIQDAMWKFSAPIDKLVTPGYFKNLRILATDQDASENCIFLGFIPGAGYTRAIAADKAMLNGFDYGWYLAKQFVPETIRITDEDTNPSETIKALLGGENWTGTTGIEPYKILDVADWGTIKKEYVWNSKTTKWKAIEEICEHTHHVFLLKWRITENNEYYSSAYFVHEDDADFDTLLDLPDMVTVTSPDPYLMSDVRIEDKQEEKYNRVICKGANKITAEWFDKTIESAGVTAGDELPIEYVYESTDMDTQAKTDAKAQELYDFFHTIAKVYSASFKKRMDLQLYQKIKFVGYDNIATDDMRITGISYRRSIAEDIVDIQFTPDQKLSDLRKLIRSMGADFMSEQQRIKEEFFIDLTKIAMGTASEIVSASEANFTLEKDAGLVNARTLEELNVGDAALLFPLEGMKDNVVAMKSIIKVGIGDNLFNHPIGIAVSGDYIFIADLDNNRIVKRLASDLSYVAQIGSSGSGDDQFNYPEGIAVSGDYIFVADSVNHRIVKRLASDLSYVSKIGSEGSGDDQFDRPEGIAVSGDYIFVADKSNHRIVKRLASDLSYVAQIGSSGSGDDQFNYPVGIAVSGDYIFVADSSNYRIVKRLASDLSYVSKIGSEGSGDDQFDRPEGIAVSGDYIFVADTRNSRIVKRLASDLSYVAQIGSSGSGDDQFSQPKGIAVSGDYIFVADLDNNRIVKRLASDLSYVAQIGSSGSGCPCILVT